LESFLSDVEMMTFWYALARPHITIYRIKDPL
jgi:hypothetical protein